MCPAVDRVGPGRLGGVRDQLGDGVGLASGRVDAPDDGTGLEAPAADDAAGLATGLVDEPGAVLAAGLTAAPGTAEVVTEAPGVASGAGE